MAGTTTPWWRDVITRAVRGIRAGVAAFFRPAKKPGELAAISPQQENIPEEEAALTNHSPQSSPERLAPAIENQKIAPEVSGAAAPEAVLPDPPVAEGAADEVPAADSRTNEAQQVEDQNTDTAPLETPVALDRLPEDSEESFESPADLLAEAAAELGAEESEAVAEPELRAVPEPELGETGAIEAAVEDEPGEVPESPADLGAEAALGIEPDAEALAEAAEPDATEAEPAAPQAVTEDGAAEVPEIPAGLLAEEPASETPEGEVTEAEAEAAEMEIVEPMALTDGAVEAGEQAIAASAKEAARDSIEEPEAEQPEEAAAEEAVADPVAEPEGGAEPSLDEMDTMPGEAVDETVVTADVETSAAEAEPELKAGLKEDLQEPGTVLEDRPVENQARPEEDVLETSPVPEPVQADAAQAEMPEPPVERGTDPTATAPTESEQPQSAPMPPQAAAAAPQVLLHEPIKREQGPDTSPVSVFVNQVYEGPFDLLLDLIRKQDIDIYDIPIAKITAQFLAYVNQLKASDMDVAGEFIYTASLLIHIKSKMLLPREPKGGDDAQEDPRRELVERLLEHERFKNAAQMLQQKQMLEAATWTNPGLREFREKAGEAEIGPEIAADTTDLVRIFRVILERARNRPMINVEEDSVTVGQMIQFLGRRLTMEDKPVALRRLLAHTKSERALIAMFLALLELVRLQAILLRQDRQFSEIFIKKNSGFEGVMNQGVAQDDWQ